MSTGTPDTPHMKAMMKQMLSETNVRAMAQLINEPEAKTRTAVAATLPVLVAALGQEAATGDGAARLAVALDRDHDGTLLNELNAYVVSGGDIVGGRKILKHVLGDRQARVEKKLAAAAKVDQGDMNRIMAALAPVVMGALAADMRENHVDSRGLADLLLGGNSPIGGLLGGATQGGVQGGGGLTGAIGGAIGSALLGSLLGGGSSSQSNSGSSVLGSLLGGVLGGGSSPAPQQEDDDNDLMSTILGGLLGGGAGGSGGAASSQSGGGGLMGSLLGGLLGGGSAPEPQPGPTMTNTGGSLSDLIAGMGGGAGSTGTGSSLPRPTTPSGTQQGDEATGMLGSLLTGLLTGGGASSSGGGAAAGSASSGASGSADLTDFIAGLSGKKR